MGGVLFEPEVNILETKIVFGNQLAWRAHIRPKHMLYLIETRNNERCLIYLIDCAYRGSRGKFTEPLCLGAVKTISQQLPVTYSTHYRRRAWYRDKSKIITLSVISKRKEHESII